MRVPTIHHDRLMGILPWMRAMTESVDNSDPSQTEEIVSRYVGFSSSSTYSALSMLGYRKYGQNSYCVGPILQTMLASTSLKGIRQADIKLPFPSFYIALDDCDWKLWGGPDTEWHPLTGIYVSMNSCFGEEDVMTVFLWAKENAKSRMPGDDASFWYRLHLDEIFGSVEEQEVATPPSRTDISKSLKEMFNDPDQEVVENHFSMHFEDDKFISPGTRALGDRDSKKYYKQMIEVNRFIINFLLYLTAENADLKDAPNKDSLRRKEVTKKLIKATQRKNARQMRKLASKLAALSQARVTYVGRELEEKLKGHAGITREYKGRRSLGYGWRPGYWNHYWTGSKKNASGEAQKGDKRIRKWVEAYEVNKDLEKLVDSRIRKVVEPAKEIEPLPSDNCSIDHGQ